MRVSELTESPVFNGGLSSASPEDAISSQGKSETQPDSVEGPAQGAGPRGAGPEPPRPARTTLRDPRSLVSFPGTQFCF